MKCKVLAHKLKYRKNTYEAGDTVDMLDDASTKVLIRLGRVAPVAAAKKKAKKKAGKKYATRAMKAED